MKPFRLESVVLHKARLDDVQSNYATAAKCEEVLDTFGTGL